MQQVRPGPAAAAAATTTAHHPSPVRAVIMILGSIALVAFAFHRINWIAAVVVFLVLVKAGVMFPKGLFNRTTDGGLSEALRRSDTMPAPITEKHGEEGAAPDLQYGYAAMQGWRRSMEDSHTAVLGLASDGTGSAVAGAAGSGSGGLAETIHCFAVFDGHCGATIAQFCGRMMPQFITMSPQFAARRYKEALVDAFITIDKHLKQDPVYGVDRSGCTANVLLVTPTELLCANAGDSRCVLCRDGRAFALSNDHKPQLPAEQRRIQRARGFVWNKRVNGVLALSRALGDFSFKNNPSVSWEEQAVTCLPDVSVVPIDRHKDEFAVVACDGIWDVMTNEQVVAFVRTRLQQGVGLRKICEQLMDACMSPHPFGLGCDNMSVVLINFRPLLASAVARPSA